MKLAAGAGAGRVASADAGAGVGSRAVPEPSKESAPATSGVAGGSGAEDIGCSAPGVQEKRGPSRRAMGMKNFTPALCRFRMENPTP